MINESILAACLSRHAGYYNQKLFLLADQFGSLTDLYSERSQKHGGKFLPFSLRGDLDLSWTDANFARMEELLDKHLITPILSTSDSYPPLLREISDRPFLIYVRGDSEVLKTPVHLSCVGTRKMTSYAEQIIPQILRELRNREICITSGLALGVDAHVHKTALGLHLKTIAVLGGGLDALEPMANRKLGESILAAGCLVSEYPPEVRPQKHHFLARNRIIAGLSQATVVIEGKKSSGALVTARYALTYGRDVGAVPGAINLETSEGPHSLLRDGAWPITESDDIVRMLNLDPHLVDETPFYRNNVHKALSCSSSTSDTLSIDLGLPIHEVHTQLTELELEGLVAQSATGAYYLKHCR